MNSFCAKYAPAGASRTGITDNKVHQALNEYCSCFFSPRFAPPGTELSSGSEPVYFKGDDPLPGRIVKTLIGSSKNRLGKYPTDTNINLMLERVGRFIERDIPIEVRLVWGPKKRFVIGEDSDIDLSEIMTLSRMYEMYSQVSRVYPPGLHYNLFLIDLEGEFIEGDSPEIKQAMTKYIDSLTALIEVLGLGKIITALRTSDVARDDQERESWKARLNENVRLLKAYWQESRERGIDGYEGYESYRAMVNLRWRGPIPQEMREYFIQRVSALYPDSTDEGKLAFVLKNFAASWLHHQIMILGVPNGMSPLNLSFVRPAPRIPDHLMKARLDLRPMAVNVTKITAPPWATKGFFGVQEDLLKPVVKGWHESLEFRDLMKRGVLVLRDGFTGAEVRVRADYLEAE